MKYEDYLKKMADEALKFDRKSYFVSQGDIYGTIKGFDKASKTLEDTEFVMFKGLSDILDINGDPDLYITFSGDDGSYEQYKLIVKDDFVVRIDGRGERVFVCERYHLVDSYYKGDHMKKTTAVTSDKNKDENKEKSSSSGWYLPDNGFAGMFPVQFPKFPEFPSFDGFMKNIDETMNELRKRNGDNYVEYGYSIDGNGNGHYRKVDKNGVVEKFFKNVDGKITEVEKKDEYAIGIDPAATTSLNSVSPKRKPELKDLIK